ncbi:DJ-1/PfpI family protein [Halomonas sp. A29]|uniref:DJ-1/PfpI family protein n=1 Tax=Halomonas sp. A29 TaxID=3102786 RepID=UPI00398B8C0D
MHKADIARPLGQAMLALATLIMAGCGTDQASSVSSLPPKALDQPLELPSPKGTRERHLVTILAANEGTETTDIIVPFGVLKASGQMDVVTVSTRPGLVELHPALRMWADQSIAAFDADQPEGADIVIVPALHHHDDPAAVQWLQQQAEKGAVIVGICDGVLTLAHAGLLREKMATGHWFTLGRLGRRYPDTTWVRDRRYVIDGQLVTTTGVSASLPVSLALVEAVAGEIEAERLATELGVSDTGASHDSSGYGLSAGLILNMAYNGLAFWKRERLELPVENGVDEIALALTADAWSRTLRASFAVTHPSEPQVLSKRGLLLGAAPSDGRSVLVQPPEEPPAAALDQALYGIEERYGARTASSVAAQLEYAW